ncbi:MAG: 16S rRNA (cytosine(1402)-N(4))-methyltransferase RsmH [Bacteroidia bacterium]|mgnify:CR=1 FL=1|nr:16S rRNA (cytosine(1402)-N(4))-methyltransferase RsmH [Bacteroidia bacterium]
MEYVSNYHTPVLLKESIEALQIKPNGTYVDCTFGGGGHSQLILKHLSKDGRLIAFDQDEHALENTLDDDRLTLVHHNFKYLSQFLNYHKASPADGILADLGISSAQINEADRGFAHKYNAQLDMRMSKGIKLSAKDIINTYDTQSLINVFRNYGEVKSAFKAANAIVAARKSGTIATTNELNSALLNATNEFSLAKNLSRVYQSLRIEVNGEMDVLKDLLSSTAQNITKGGVLVVISYHSLEDRLVKQFIQNGSFSKNQTKDFYGNIDRPFEPLGKMIIPSKEEIEVNSRARSAKMRIAIRN